MKKKLQLSLYKILVIGGAGIYNFVRAYKKFAQTFQVQLPSSWHGALKFWVGNTLKKQVRFLQKNDHWDQMAVQTYIKKVLHRLEEVETVEKALLVVTAAFDQAQRVGSPIYTQMYQSSQLKAKKKLRLVLRHLGAWIDEDGFLQLTGSHQFAEELPPHADFYAVLRADVWQTYSATDGLNRDSLGLRLHLFRSWIDRQNLEYVRRQFNGPTDFAKLQAYAAQTEQSLDFTTNAAFHNRYQQKFTYPHQMKVQVPASNTCKSPGLNNARMAEFIVDLETEQFISEWDVYRQEAGLVVATPAKYDQTELAAIANTESFNYGIPHGQQADLPVKDQRHNKLDVDHPADPALRRLATQTFHSPKTLVAGGPYVDLVKHLADLRAWQSVPLEQKTATYQDYFRACQQHGKVSGFSQLNAQRKES